MVGLWACSIYNVSNNWINWCKENDFLLIYNTYRWFKFELLSNNILLIDSVHKLESLPHMKCKTPGLESLYERKDMDLLDYEELAKKYDAIEFDLEADPELNMRIYGLDVSSILVMNPKVVKEIESSDRSI